ncbi:dihydrolipoamide acetyltransferase family protein [Cuniculiplasma sp. SKW3]|uniref:dihydrolipoamide acetyltransferase family protein n=1 Tax=Cuniculiplasma sp. SKW3 TaxID=3400170 RepID=UPI003FD3B9F1
MFKFKLPDIGEGVTEGEIIKWLVKEGDTVKKDQEMVEIMTDKVNISIPSPVEGKVTKILFQEGNVVQVGKEIIEIDDGQDHPEAGPSEVKSDEKPGNETAPGSVEEKSISGSDKKMTENGDERRILASPTIRRIAKERGIDLDLVKPTGPNGRVTIEDLDRTERELKEAEELKKSGVAATKAVEPQKTIAEKPKEPAVQTEAVKEAAPVKDVKTDEKPPEVLSPQVTKENADKIKSVEGDQVFEPRGLRRLIFEKMTKSKQLMPHFMVAETVDITQIVSKMNELKDKGSKVTLTPFFVKAVAVALSEFPKFNAHYDEAGKKYIFKKNINIGVAIDTPDGLTVAVIKNAIDKSVVQISDEISELARKARENKLTLQDVQDSTFTLTNVGTIGGIISTPIINYPEVAILAVHRMLNESDGTNSKNIMYISLSCDHRLIDGADAARFIIKVKGYLQDPISFLIR